MLPYKGSLGPRAHTHGPKGHELEMPFNHPVARTPVAKLLCWMNVVMTDSKGRWLKETGEAPPMLSVTEAGWTERTY